MLGESKYDSVVVVESTSLGFMFPFITEVSRMHRSEAWNKIK